MLENPCKPDCPDRSPTCHATCVKYFVFDIFKEHERNTKKKQAIVEDGIYKTSRHYNAKKRRKPYADNYGDY